MSYQAQQERSRLSEPFAHTTPVEQRSPSRWVICAIGACVGAFIVAEPFVIDAKPSLQIFQGVFMAYFWALFMFGDASHRRSSRK